MFELIALGDRRGLADALATDPGLANTPVDEETPLAAACLVVTADRAIPAQDAGEAAHGIVDELLLAGASPSTPTSDGTTPLHCAAFCGNQRLATRLLDAGANPSSTIAGVPGSTPLSFALFYGHSSTARTLAAVERVPNDLRSAAGLNDTAAIDHQLSTDGDLRPGADEGMAFTAPLAAFPPRSGPITAQLTIDESLTWACRNGSLDAARMLVARGADVNSNPYRGTPLLWATYSDEAGIAQWLIDNGADVNLRHDFGGSEHGRGATALHLAAQYGAIGCIDVLIAAGADPELIDDRFESTPIEWARHSGQLAAVEYIRTAVER